MFSGTRVDAPNSEFSWPDEHGATTEMILPRFLHTGYFLPGAAAGK
jgi:hypothetical protein